MKPASRRAMAATWDAPAKVNLCLRVVGRREDGYHLLDSIFVPIDWCDRVTAVVRDVRLGGDPEIEIAVSMPDVPADGRNLAVRAAVAVLAERGLGARVVLTLEKHIPPGSGLGGGSSDAAAVMRGLNALLGLDISPDRLRTLALALGADVPFFLAGGAARVRGVGERVELLAGWPDLRMVVAVPPFAVSTAWAFGQMAMLPLAAGDEPAALAGGTAPTQALLVNDLERAVLPHHPEIAALKAAMRTAGATAAVMSGSGSAVVAVVSTEAVGARVAAAVEGALPGVRARPCRPFDPRRGG